MANNYFKVPIRDVFEEEAKKLKSDLERRGYKNVSWTELFAVLLEKNRRTTLSEKDLDNIMRRLRGML